MGYGFIKQTCATSLTLLGWAPDCSCICSSVVVTQIGLCYTFPSLPWLHLISYLKASPPPFTFSLNSYRGLLPVSSFLLPLSSSHSLSHTLLCISGCSAVIILSSAYSGLHPQPSGSGGGRLAAVQGVMHRLSEGESGVRPHKGHKSGKTDAVLASSAALNYWPEWDGGMCVKHMCVRVGYRKSMCAQV